MHDTLKKTENLATPEKRGVEVRVDLYSRYRSPHLNSFEKGVEDRIKDEQRMLEREVPKTHTELGREQIVIISSNLEVLRRDMMVEKVLKQEQALYGGNLAKKDIVKDAYELQG